jgi:hypothetical protein
MAADNGTNIKDDVYELFAFVRSNFKGSELSKIERAFGFWDKREFSHALECFGSILRNKKGGFNEKIIARTGMTACFAEREETEKVLSRLGMISGMFRENFFLGSCYFFSQLRESEISPERINIAIEVFKRVIAIVEKLEIESEEAGANENRRITGVIKISARINLAKLQIFQEIWEDGLGNLLQAEELAVAKKDYVVLLEIYRLIIKSYYNLEGESSVNAREYEKKHHVTLNIVAQKR